LAHSVLKRQAARIPKTREEFVVESLREGILAGELEPGEKLDQQTIAELLGVSRSPVRVALRMLAVEGLVEMHPHQGAAVAEMSSGELRETYDIRGILEGRAAKKAVSKLDDEHLAAMEAILEQLDETTDLDEWIKLNNRFHCALYEVVNQPRLFSLLRRLRNSTAPYARQYVASSEHMREARADHHRILEACMQRDGSRAQRETQKHLESVGKSVVKHMISEEERSDGSV
jgi:DNA-binding GntR family transcriptional regulator